MYYCRPVNHPQVDDNSFKKAKLTSAAMAMFVKSGTDDSFMTIDAAFDVSSSLFLPFGLLDFPHFLAPLPVTYMSRRFFGRFSTDKRFLTTKSMSWVPVTTYCGDSNLQALEKSKLTIRRGAQC